MKRFNKANSARYISILTNDINIIKNYGITTRLNLVSSFSIYSGLVEAFSQNLGMLMFSAPITIGRYFVIKGDLTKWNLHKSALNLNAFKVFLIFL